MLSIIIPTMQKDLEVINKLLLELGGDETVGKILVIDNSCKDFKADKKKVKVFAQKEKLLVTPDLNFEIKFPQKIFLTLGF